MLVEKKFLKKTRFLIEKIIGETERSNPYNLSVKKKKKKQK